MTRTSCALVLGCLAGSLSLLACGGALDCKSTAPGPSATAPVASSAPAASASVAQAPTPLLEPTMAPDEGMWLLNDFPSERVAQRYGFTPSQAWLDEARLASVRLAQGCSGSFVSPNGLVMTNHHCAHRCIEQISTGKKDYVANGFSAASEKDEVKCPSLEVNQLVAITDVSERVLSAGKDKSGAARNEAQKAEQSKIEKECATGAEVRCDVVNLYHGGKFQLYKYQRFQDVRLVFAPEFSIAFFGGDPDNFNFPRYDLDMSFLRVYKDGKPLKSEHFFPWSQDGTRAGELTFVSGHPWSTSRMLTVSELAYLRDYVLPERLLRLTEARGVLSQFQTRGPEQKRISSATLFGIENGIKALKGRHQALLDAKLFGAKQAEEQALRARVQADPKLKASVGDAWEAIAAAQEHKRQIRKAYNMLENGNAFWSKLAGFARTLVRASDELPKPNEKRLREYVDSQLPALRQELFSSAPIYDELEIVTLTLSLTQMREELGADHLVVKKVLGNKSPAELAAALIHGTKLKNIDVRKALLEGGKAAIEASKDPLIELARALEPEARALRTDFDDTIEATTVQNSEKIAQVRFQIYGTKVYPDATATLRLSFGQVQGWEENGKRVEPITTFEGAFARHTGASPFALPKSWLDARAKLDMKTPFNFCSTNDIIGGNSGSPVINQKGEIVGLIFDGNIHSLGGDYAFDESSNRAVALHSAAILHALDKVYGANRLRDELLATQGKSK